MANTKAPMNGRRSWSYATWARYVAAGKSPSEVRRRLELARLEAPNGATAELERAAERKLALLEDRPIGTVDSSPAELEARSAPRPAGELEADGADAQAGGEAWWW